MTGTFLEVVCPECDNEQVVFERPSTVVTCAACGEPLARPTGGIAEVSAEVVGVVEDR